MKKITLLLLLLIIFIGVTIVSYKELISSFLISRILSQNGVEQSSLRVTSISLDHMAMDHLYLSLPGNNTLIKGEDILVKLTLMDWAKAFSRNKLSRFTQKTDDQQRQTGKPVDTISIKRLDIRLDSANKKTAKPKTIQEIKQKISKINNNIAATNLPFNELTIQKLKIIGEQTGLIADKEFACTISQKNRQPLQISVFEEHLDWLATIEQKDKQQLELTIKNTEDSSPVLESQLKSGSEGIELSIYSQLETIKKLSDSIKLPLPEIRGVVTLFLKIYSNGGNNRFISKLEVNNLKSDNLQTDKIKLVTHGNFSKNSLILDSGSNLSCQRLKSDKLILQDLSFDLDGSIHLAKDQWEYRPKDNNMIKVSGLATGSIKTSYLELQATNNSTIGQNGQQTQVQLGQQSQIRGQNLHINKLSIPGDFSFSLAKQQLLTLTKDSWTLSPTLYQAGLKQLTYDNIKLSSDKLTIKTNEIVGNNSGYQIKTNLTTNDLHIANEQNGIELKDVNIDLSLDNNKNGNTKAKQTVRVDALFSPAHIPGRFKAELTSYQGRGKVKVSNKKPLSLSATSPLSSIVDKWPMEHIDLIGGTLNIESITSWQPETKLQSTLNISLQQGNGFFKEIQLANINLKHHLHLTPKIESVKADILKIGKISLPGLEIRNAQAYIKIKPSPYGSAPMIAVNNLILHIMDGTLEATQFIYDLNRPEVKTDVVAKNIDLQKIVQIQQVKGLEVTGKVNGTLPVLYNKDGLHINNGIIKNSTPAGTIKYTSNKTEGLKNSPITGYAVKILEDFHYNLLSASAEYSPDGNLNISLHLQGTSPKVENKRPIHLNINTEQNILSLIESLKYSQGVEKKINKRLEDAFKR